MSAVPLSALSAEEKRALLRRLLAERSAGAAGASDDTPLVPGQLALWFLQTLAPDSCAYNVAFTARLRPGLDLPAFRRALDTLVARHDALRTVFPARDGEPVQRVLPAVGTPLEVVELGDRSDAEAHAAVRADYQRPFRLDESLVRVVVYRRADDDLLLVNVHHLVSDAWSVQVLFDELRALYAAELEGRRATLPALGARYRDFVAWQRQLLDGARGEQLWRYWQTALADAPPALALADARPRPPVVHLRGATVPFAIDPPLASALRALAASRQTTLYTVLLAAMQVLLQRFSGQSDVTIGTPVSLRTRSEWAQVVGYYINTLPIRGRVDAAAPFTDQLAHARGLVLGALAHQEFPFSLMVDRLRVRREPNRSPLFQAMLNVHTSARTSELSRLFSADAPYDGVRFGASCLTPFLIPQQEGQFEIAIEVTESDGALYGNLKYQTDLYTADTAMRMRDAYCALLAAIATDPTVRVADLPIAPPREDFEV